MPLPRFRIRTLMIGTVFAAIAAALLSTIRTLDDREKPASYLWILGWTVCVLALWFAITRWGSRPWDAEDRGASDPE